MTVYYTIPRVKTACFDSRLLLIFAVVLLSPTLALAQAERIPTPWPKEISNTELSVKRSALLQELTQMGIGNRRVLQAISAVPRERFIPRKLLPHAYDNTPLPIGRNQTISQPYIVAFMTAALKLKKGERVLEIGTGSGYQAAVLAEVGAVVYSIEIIPALAKRAAKILRKLNYNSIELKTGNGYQGWEEKAPFDAIIVTAAPKSVPQALLEQLKDGGRIILPLGGSSQELVLIKKTGEEYQRNRLLPVRFVPMTGEKG